MSWGPYSTNEILDGTPAPIWSWGVLPPFAQYLELGVLVLYQNQTRARGTWVISLPGVPTKKVDVVLIRSEDMKANYLTKAGNWRDNLSLLRGVVYDE
ncbi:hypothetical protein PPACK8108_LOCUS9583 [Phakopsora pachyrhizi]|uniref:Uncharacterized protein n=1 Tax=Phakopsora pachyrhizi TaxID=170000 RepID=A0AAV0AYB2_PHAPC|nr:hypothetical protein PPACK8108_LOCUS9583 [Phakopsora pachyrhizi]